MAQFQFSTLQASHAVQGDYSSSDYTVPGIGVGIYTADGGDVGITTIGGDSIVFTSVPAGTFMQVPLFVSVDSANTGSADLTISYMKPPYR